MGVLFTFLKGENDMSKFVQFFARGIIYSRDKNGRPNGVKDYRQGGGSRSTALRRWARCSCSAPIFSPATV